MLVSILSVSRYRVVGSVPPCLEWGRSIFWSCNRCDAFSCVDMRQVPPFDFLFPLTPAPSLVCLGAHWRATLVPCFASVPSRACTFVPGGSWTVPIRPWRVLPALVLLAGGSRPMPLHFLLPTRNIKSLCVCAPVVPCWRLPRYTSCDAQRWQGV